MHLLRYLPVLSTLVAAPYARPTAEASHIYDESPLDALLDHPWLGLQVKPRGGDWLAVTIASIDLGDHGGKGLQLIALHPDPQDATYHTIPPRFVAESTSVTDNTHFHLTWTGIPQNVDPDFPSNNITTSVHIFKDPDQIFDPSNPRTGLAPFILEPLSLKTPADVIEAFAGDAVVFNQPQGDLQHGGQIDQLLGKKYVLCDGSADQGAGWLGVVNDSILDNLKPPGCAPAELRLNVVLL